ncbi:hypothetical protein A6J48_13080 [Neisseria meningitidis]|nr:hypothetical protein A6J48_13080 [Neisseria meningitidis]
MAVKPLGYIGGIGRQRNALKTQFEPLKAID